MYRFDDSRIKNVAMCKQTYRSGLSMVVCVLACLAGMTGARAQTIIPLYDRIPNEIPAANREVSHANPLVDSVITEVSVPTLSIFLPKKKLATRTAVIICPGGGYQGLLIVREGNRVARRLAREGVAAFVLKYRLPSARTMKDPSIGPLQDVQRAIQLVRQHAAAWNVDPGRLGVMGFSAGGHLASLAGTHFSQPVIPNAGQTDLRPDFLLLLNPVISFDDSIGHAGSRMNLLGDHPSADKLVFFSSEKQVNAQTPPSFLVHTSGDSVVPYQNSYRFFAALIQAGVPAELHLYQHGEHGFLTSPSFEEWFGRCLGWMKSNGWLTRPARK